MKIVPANLSDANAFIQRLHRHHKPVVGWKFGVAAEHKGIIVGVATVGRPIARMSDNGRTLEVTRLCTDGTKNACSFLYAACRRIAFEMGYEKIQTFILESETGKSLEAAGWTLESITNGGLWDRPSRKRGDNAPTCAKKKYISLRCERCGKVSDE